MRKREREREREREKERKKDKLSPRGSESALLVLQVWPPQAKAWPCHGSPRQS